MIPLSYSRHRFPPPVIQHSIWLYLRFTLSYRDVEDLLAERGLDLVLASTATHDSDCAREAIETRSRLDWAVGETALVGERRPHGGERIGEGENDELGQWRR